MLSFIGLLGGAAAKIYDDIEDNNLLQKFRNNTLMEFLKGIHYISFTSLSVHEPMFFILQYLVNCLHSITNKEGYSKHYESSLLYSFSLLFIIIDYKKITSFTLIDKLLIIFFFSTICFEPLIMKLLSADSEHSFIKLIIRGIGLILVIGVYNFITANSLKYIYIYFIGYAAISVLVQYYSLREEKLKKEELKEEKEKEESEVKETKETKEETKEIKEVKGTKEVKETKEEKETKETKEEKETKETKEK